MLAVQAVAANSLFQVMNFPVHTGVHPFGETQKQGTGCS